MLAPPHSRAVAQRVLGHEERDGQADEVERGDGDDGRGAGRKALADLLQILVLEALVADLAPDPARASADEREITVLMGATHGEDAGTVHRHGLAVHLHRNQREAQVTGVM